jgi:glycosyltransferase involved in cell wall biosynthesis
MSAARVVVASNTGPVSEVIEHGVNGLLFDFFDVQALSRQVVEVLSNHDGFRDIGNRAREMVVQRYDLKGKCLPELINLILGK